VKGSPRQLLLCLLDLWGCCLETIESKTIAQRDDRVNWADRWQVYQRLQELAIPCWCATDQPLRVETDVAAVSLCVGQLTAPRQDLVRALERC